MNTIYLLYIFGETDVDLLFLSTEKQSISLSFPFIPCQLGGKWGISTPDRKLDILGRVLKKAQRQLSTFLGPLFVL